MTSTSSTRESIKSTPRPRDRKAQIVSAARALFADKGYAAVSADEIAGRVGITAGALYRHFSGKQDLLVHGLIDALDAAADAVREEPATDIDSLVDAILKVAASTRELGVLWGREVRLLDADHRAVVRRHFFATFGVIRDRLALVRHDLGAAEIELLTWSVLAVLTSVSYHREALSERIRDELHDLTVQMCGAQLFDAGEQTPTTQPQGVRPNGRRELIITAAADLFHRRGFNGTSMSDIGDAIGLTGAAIYRYYPTKVDVLSAIVARALGAMQIGLMEALADADTSEQALEHILNAYVRFAIQNPHLIDVLLWEVRDLPEVEQHAVRRAQREYIAEWEALLRKIRPTLGADEARVAVQAVLTVVNDAVRTASLRRHPALGANLERLGRSMLTGAHRPQRS